MRAFLLIIAAFAALPELPAAERAGNDSRGRIIALPSEGGEVEVSSNCVAVGPGGKRTVLLERQVRGGPRNQGQLTPGARGRAVNPSKWDELAQLLVDYLLYARREFGVEPDMFSFNEGNVGVNVRLTPEEHTMQIKLLGAAFRKAGLKTRMLLGDAVPARDSHVFALDAAADPEALQYVAGVAFHSWGGATPKQYSAWGDLADWLERFRYWSQSWGSTRRSLTSMPGTITTTDCAKLS